MPTWYYLRASAAGYTGLQIGACMEKNKLPIVYSCSGCSTAAQMANHIAIKMDRDKIAEMSCIAGVGGDVPSLVRVAKTAETIIALDGCQLKCTKNILARHSIKPNHHIVLSDLGVAKRIHQDFDPQEAKNVYDKVTELLKPDYLTEQDLLENKLLIREPFAEYLKATESEYSFAITLLDIVRFAGHACPSMIGAFLIAKVATRYLFPDEIVLRGDVQIATLNSIESGATGPIFNVFSMVFGAWGASGFGGLSGQFRRRDLLEFENQHVPSGAFRFQRLSTGKTIDVYYTPGEVIALDDKPTDPFPLNWRKMIKKILVNVNQCVKVADVSKNE